MDLPESVEASLLAISQFTKRGCVVPNDFCSRVCFMRIFIGL